MCSLKALYTDLLVVERKSVRCGLLSKNSKFTALKP